jgi:hypothetical protein
VELYEGVDLEERGEIFLSVRQHFLFGIFNI